MHQLLFLSQAKKYAKKIASSGLKPKVQELLMMIEPKPLCNTHQNLSIYQANYKGKSLEELTTKAGWFMKFLKKQNL